LFCLGKDKSVVSNTPLVSKGPMQGKQLGDKGKMSEAKKTMSDSSLFTEPQSGIRIV